MHDPGLGFKVSRGEKMLYSRTDPESYITEYTSVYEAKTFDVVPSSLGCGTRNGISVVRRALLRRARMERERSLLTTYWSETT